MVDDELRKIGFFDGWAKQSIREKFGIDVFRITRKNESYVGKFFSDEQLHGRQEINYYTMLRAIGVPTLEVKASTNCLLLLEDITTSAVYRLGIESDVNDVSIARLIGDWFKLLHTRGKTYEGLTKLNLLDNVVDELSHSKVVTAIEKSGTAENPFWNMLINNMDKIKRAYLGLCNTITYNDFWWDNLAVAKDLSSIIMFDYNCVYRKYAYADIRHIPSVLSKDAGVAFLEAYGKYDEAEKIFEDLYFPLSGLISAFNMDAFPTWANKFLDLFHSGELMQRMNKFENNF